MDHSAWQEMDKYKIQLREDMKRRKIPYLSVEVFNTQQPRRTECYGHYCYSL